jgi:hypothetical protein
VKLRLPQPMLLAFVLLLPLTVYSQTSSAITENQLTALVNSLDQAAKKGNIAGIIAPLSRDVKIKVSIVSPSNEEKVLTLTKSQYAFHTKTVLRQRLAYAYERKNTRFKIYEDGKTATVTSDVYETLTLKQGTVRAVSSEVAIVNLRGGKLFITSIDGRTRFY